MKTVVLGLFSSLVFSTQLVGATIDLTGTWAGSCVPNPEAGTSLQLHFVFNDAFGNTDRTLANMNLFADQECQVLARKVNFVAAYQQGDIFGEGTAFTMTIGTMLDTPLNDEVTELLNTANHCGYSDWVSGVSKVVEQRHCKRGMFAGSGPSLYTIIAVRQNEAGDSYLVWGDRSGENNGTSEDKRPSTLDANRRFTKVKAGL